MKQFKKLIACVLAATLVLGSTTVFFGAETEKQTSDEGSFEGGGDFEGSVDTEVFNVVVPVEYATDTASSSAFDFILDPEGLINTTSGAAHTGMTFPASGGTMYFKVSGNAYDTKSQTLVAKNLSSTDVNITLDAKVTVPTSNAALTLAEDANWGTDTALEIYLEIVEVSDDGISVATSAAIATEATATTAGAVYTGGLKSTLESYADAYEVVYTSGVGYEFKITTAAAVGVTADTYEFYITGACNTNADWSQYVEGEDPEISVVWKVEMVGAETETADPVTSVKGVAAVDNVITLAASYNKSTGVSLPYTVASGDITILSVKFGTAATNVSTAIGSNNLSTANSTIKITGLWQGASSGDTRYVHVTFSDGTVAKITLTVE